MWSGFLFLFFFLLLLLWNSKKRVSDASHSIYFQAYLHRHFNALHQIFVMTTAFIFISFNIFYAIDVYTSNGGWMGEKRTYTEKSVIFYLNFIRIFYYCYNKINWKSRDTFFSSFKCFYCPKRMKQKWNHDRWLNCSIYLDDCECSYRKQINLGKKSQNFRATTKIFCLPKFEVGAAGKRNGNV